MDLETYIQVVVYVFTGIIGLCVGSFLNVVIYRVPLKMSIAYPPSHCTACDYTLRWYDNIPVLSYIMLKGRCRKCGSHISVRYTIVEILNMLLWLCSLWRFGFDDWRSAVCAGIAAIVSSVCLCVACIDLEHKLIFDRFQIIMLVLGIAYSFISPAANIIENVICAFVFGFVFFGLGFIVGKIAGKEALGGGDIKFAFVSALFLGFGKALLMMLIASIGACVVILLKKGRNKDFEYPFAPFLTAGFMAALLFGDAIINTYFKILGLE